MAIYNATGTVLTQAFESDGDSLATAYDKDGNAIFSPTPYAPQLSFHKSILMSVFNQNKVISPQGMAVFGNYIVQYFTEDDSIAIIDRTDWSIDGYYELSEFLHGNGLVFGNTIQQSGFPLLYGSQFGESQSEESRYITIANIGLSTYSIEGYYEIPASAGYHPQFVADWANGKGYTIGYAQLSTGSGNMTISEFDITDMTTVENQWTVSYMGVMQGSCFWNGYIVVIGDSYNYSKVKVNFINVQTHEKTVFEFTKYQDHRMEFQGVDVIGNDLLISSWVYDESDSSTLKYWLYTMNLPDAGQTVESIDVT